MPTRYTVTAAAHALNVSVSTVRRIADELSAHLPDYQPIPDAPRLFTEADVRAIAAILTRLQASPGLTRSALLKELSTPGNAPLIIPDTLPKKAPSSPPDSPRAPIASTVVSDSPAQLPAALQTLSALGESMARLEARIDGLQVPPAQTAPARAPDSLSLVAAAVAVGVLIGALVAAAVWPQSTAPVIVCIGVALCCLLFAIVYPMRR